MTTETIKPARVRNAAKASTLRASKSNLPKAKAKSNAKAKGPTKAERERAQDTRHRTQAAKGSEGKEVGALMAAYVQTAGTNASAARILGAALNAEFAADMKAHKVHWKFIHASKNAKAEGSNLRPLWERIEARRLEVQELALKNDRINHASRNKLWSDLMAAALSLTDYAKKVEGPTLSTAAKAKRELVKLYKALMREEMPTDVDLATTNAIGALLRNTYKVDLSSLNV